MNTSIARSGPLVRHPFLRELGWMTVAILSIKLCWLVLDPTLRVYMGDSMVYLQTAAWLSGSPGRSYLYGALLHFTAYPLHSPLAIIVLQALCSTVTALTLFAFLRLALGVRMAMAVAAALLLATEPAQIFFERMVMAETVGLLSLIATLLAYSRYLQTRSLYWYLLGCLFGLATGNFRTSLLPVVVGLALVAPAILLSTCAGIGGDWKRRLRHVAAAAAILAGSHLAYTHAYGIAMKAPPGYLALTGMMRIGLVAPLIEPEHFEGTGVSGDVLQQVKLPLADHWQRGNHIWSEQGLWRVLEKNSTDPERVARTITRRAMLDHPLRLLQINVETLGGYFDPQKTYWRMMDDKGAIAPDARARELIREWLHYDIEGVDTRETPARAYFSLSSTWLTACLVLLGPLALASLAAGWRTPQRPQFLLLSLASLGLVASHLLFSHIVSFRYLHPFPWFVFANIAVIAGTPWRTSTQRRAGATQVSQGLDLTAPMRHRSQDQAYQRGKRRDDQHCGHKDGRRNPWHQAGCQIGVDKRDAQHDGTYCEQRA